MLLIFLAARFANVWATDAAYPAHQSSLRRELASGVRLSSPRNIEYGYTVVSTHFKWGLVLKDSPIGAAPRSRQDFHRALLAIPGARIIFQVY